MYIYLIIQFSFVSNVNSYHRDYYNTQKTFINNMKSANEVNMMEKYGNRFGQVQNFNRNQTFNDNSKNKPRSYIKGNQKPPLENDGNHHKPQTLMVREMSV